MATIDPLGWPVSYGVEFLMSRTARLIFVGALIVTTVALTAGGDDKVVVKPGDDLHDALGRTAASGTLVLMPGTYELSAPLSIKTKEVRIEASKPRGATIVAGEALANRGSMLKVDAPGVSLHGLVLDGRFVPGLRAVRGIRGQTGDSSGSASLVIDDCEVFHFARHALDLDGDETQVRDCDIYQNLWFRNGERADAHGVVTSHAHGMRVEGCDIRQCSGDCIQAERGSWDDFRVVDCELWDAPLEEDMGGFAAGMSVTENAIDTKHRFANRGRIAVTNCRIHGFRSELISNPSALNLKENADVVVDGCVVYDSNIAFRLRGRSKGMWMYPAVVNCLVGGNNVAFRLEDKLQRFRMFHCTVYGNKQTLVWAPGRPTWDRDYFQWDRSGWANVNNLWVGLQELPEISAAEELGARDNHVLSTRDVDEWLVPKKPILVPETPALIDRWYEPSGRVTKDKHGTVRPEQAMIGAQESAPAETDTDNGS